MGDEARPGQEQSGVGFAYALGAYGLWGFAALYFKALDHVSPGEILAHRVVWSVVFCGLLLTWLGRWGEVRVISRSWSSLAVLAVSAALVAVNWLVFIYAVVSEQLVEASLGYFLNPLVSIMLGMVFLGERLRGVQWLAVGLAAAGVVFLWISEGLPWIALTLACSFGAYGLVRKQAKPGPLAGLMVETSLLAPLAIGYLVWLSRVGGGPDLVFVDGAALDRLLLVSAGLVTSVPLMWFAAGARRLPLSTMGFLQFLTPTMQFVIGLSFGEAFDPDRAVAFGLIWLGVGVFVRGVLRARRSGRG